MATGVLVLAESGSGKTTSARTLPPEETFIINVSGKDLPWKGWKKQYTIWDKDNNSKGNLYKKSSPKAVENAMKYVSAMRPEIKYLVVDDFQYVSAFQFFDRGLEKGYDKFTEIAQAMKNIGALISSLREDLIVFMMNHVDEDRDVYGNLKISTKSIGKMVKEKLTFEGLFTIVLYGRPRKDDDNNMQYLFETQTDGTHPAKSPIGMFDTKLIPNDLKIVADTIRKYELGE
jgi:hypothetical protein